MGSESHVLRFFGFAAAINVSKKMLQNLWAPIQIRTRPSRKITHMNQITPGLDPLPRKTRKEVFLDEMNQVLPWSVLVTLIQPHARGAHQALGGRPPFAVERVAPR